ncbi:MAG TPA: TonB-dependent receptor, partial [Pirellulaceae bacterium]|nr:TonB-dependent receptor [Pirellulaceae bacterium]
IPPTQGYVGLRWRDQELRSYFDIYTWLVRRQDRYASANLGDVRFIPGGTPGYATLNLRAGTALGHCQQHRLSISLENITDKYYRVLGSGVDGAGFNAIVGYEFVH